MTQYSAMVHDERGDLLFGFGWGDYIEAHDAHEAREVATAKFFQPIDDEVRREAPALAASIERKQAHCREHGMRITVRKVA